MTVQRSTATSNGSKRAKVDDRFFDKFDIVHPDSAGIDIGAESHYVSIPDDRDAEPVRTFGCFTPDLEEMAAWLKQHGIHSIAMESTGVYWVPVYQILISHGFDVQLVDARHAKNVPGRKTDVWDCRWLRKLHTFGLLRGCFLPPADITVIRTYCRQRASLVQACAEQTQLMQKSLEQMNIQLHKALSDITGLTGMRIIRAIVGGERSAKRLSHMKHSLVKCSDEDLVKALTADYRDEHLFTLSQALATFDFLHKQITECDTRIEAALAILEDKCDPNDISKPGPGSGSGSRRRNQPHFDLHRELVRTTGVDLTKVTGVSTLTAQTIISEIGTNVDAFPTERHFASWLGLCPNNRITGGKVRNRRTRKVTNRVATALRIAAQSLHRSKCAMGAYYRRMRAKLGAPKAITATAHKLARLIYCLLKHGTEFVEQGQAAYEQQYEERRLAAVRKTAKSMGFALVSISTGELVS
jgi:transposase